LFKNKEIKFIPLNWFYLYLHRVLLGTYYERWRDTPYETLPTLFLIKNLKLEN
jgi:hypothetical protein